MNLELYQRDYASKQHSDVKGTECDCRGMQWRQKTLVISGHFGFAEMFRLFKKFLR